jgi:ribonucleoside-triphosphate reductase
MSIKALSDYTFYSRYSQYDKEKQRRETWDESVERLFKMHRIKYADKIKENEELSKLIDFAETQQKKKRVLAAQRSLQFAIEPILKHQMKMYNCSTVHINRERAFQEIMYVLLCGCGVGFSVQKHHIDQIGEFVIPEGDIVEYKIEDSIEGWADAIGVLIASWSTKTWDNFAQYQGKNICFDYSDIRPEGSLIAGRFKAPGPKGLEATIEKIESVFKRRCGGIITALNNNVKPFKLKPIDAYDLVCHISDAVLSGGVRRSATICMFSHDDNEMMEAKTGNWFIENPQRGRSNNSAVLVKGEVSKEEFSKLIKSTREFGEPGFIWVDDKEIVFNPCCEIGMIPTTRDGRSGWQTCNLTEINGKFCDSEENFLQACEASAIIGTLQAGYTDFKYLTNEAKEIIEEEALLGCSITGWMDNPDILFDPKLQRKGAKMVLETNERVAKLLGIKTAARATCVKPAGSTSCVLGTASGIHPHHARRYIRRVQVNKQEFCGHIFQKYNPLAVEESVWSVNKTDNVISFLCEVPNGAITKNQVSAIDLLEKVKLTQQNWVEYGTRVDRCVNPKLRHNVSNTINVKDAEWEDVKNFIYNNQKYFAGISLLPASGDLDYAQAPFSTVLTPNELVREYGDASVFASGLIVDGQHAFDGNLWEGCNAVLGLIKLDDCGIGPEYPKERNYKALAQYFEAKEKYESCILKEDWVRRVKQFGERYFEGNIKKATYCLKHVSLWKTWCDLKREYKNIDWEDIKEVEQEFQNADEQAAQACAGGKCEISF